MVAVKRMNCNAAEEMLHQMKRESAILLRVANDPNIVQFFGTCPCNPPMICMEFMEVSEACLKQRYISSEGRRTHLLGLGHSRCRL